MSKETAGIPASCSRNPTRPDHLEWLATQLDGRVSERIAPTQSAVVEAAFLLRQWAKKQRDEKASRKRRAHSQIALEAVN